MKFCPLPDPKFQLGDAPLKIEADGHEGVALLPDSLPEADDLMAMKEELPSPVGLVVEVA